MSMEFKLNSAGGVESRALFRGGRMELPGSFSACRDIKGSGGDELCEELEPERELDFSSETTGRLVEEVTNLSIHKYLAGHLGGEKQLGAQIENNDIDLVIFLRDPLTPKSHEPETTTLFQLCDVHNIPLATNLASAELLIKALDRGDLEWRELYK